MVEVSTLTGGVVAALGEHCGLFANCDDLAKKINVSSKIAHESFW